MGINASDINFSAGRYDPSKKPPFEAGFEVCFYFIYFYHVLEFWK